MKFKSIFLSCISVAAIAILSANASAATGNVVVKASVASGCTIADVQELNFGQLDQTSNNPVTTTGKILYWCTKDTPYTISMDNGEQYELGLSKRQMKVASGAALLPYELAADEDAGIGNGPTTNETLTLTGTILAPDIKAASAGSYLDNVIVTIEP